MKRPRPAPPDSSSSLIVASAKVLRANQLLGQLASCASLAEFADTAAELVMLTRAASQMIAGIRDDSAIRALKRDPLEVAAKLPPIYTVRVARGSGPPPFNGVAVAAPHELFFEGLDKRPALEMCAVYLERVTRLLDETRDQLRGQELLSRGSDDLRADRLHDREQDLRE